MSESSDLDELKRELRYMKRSNRMFESFAAGFAAGVACDEDEFAREEFQSIVRDEWHSFRNGEDER